MTTMQRLIGLAVIPIVWGTCGAFAYFLHWLLTPGSGAVLGYFAVLAFLFIGVLVCGAITIDLVKGIMESSEPKSGS